MFTRVQLLHYRYHNACKFDLCQCQLDVKNCVRFNIFRECNIINNVFYRNLLVKNVSEKNINLTRISVGNHFNIGTENAITTKIRLNSRAFFDIEYRLCFSSHDHFAESKFLSLPIDWYIIGFFHKHRAIEYKNLVEIKTREQNINNNFSPDVLTWDSGILLDRIGDVFASHGTNRRDSRKLLQISINAVETNLNENISLPCIRNNICNREISLSLRSINSLSRNFNFCHSNVQGLLESTHFDQLNRLISKFNSLSVIAIGETFLRSSNTNKSVEINGFKILRADRAGRKNDRNKGGGVAIYLNKNFKHKIILNSSKNNHGFKFVDFLVIEIVSKFSKVIFGVIYRTKDCSNEDSRNFFDLITNTVQRSDNVILAGDFNINFLNDKINRNAMNNFAYNFSVLNDDCPTHFWPGKNPSQIDLIFTNNKSKVDFFGHFPSGISFHDMIIGSYKILSDNKVKNITVTSRNFNKINLVNLKNAIRSLDWNFVNCLNIDDKVSALNSNIINLLNQFAPLKTRKFKHAPKPWFSDKIKRAIKDRDNAYNNWKKADPGNSESIIQLENIYRESEKQKKKLINKSKKETFANNISNARSGKDKWRLIKNEGCAKDSDNNDEDILNNFNLNDFNSHFASIHSSSGANLNEININNNIQNQFSFREINKNEFFEAFNKIKSNAIGDDDIPLKFLKLIINDTFDSIISIFNFCIKEHVYPRCWNSIIIKPLNKIPNPQSVSEFRPISITCVISKIFAIILNNQIINYLESESILHDHQSGFRQNHSCTTALLNISEKIRKSISNKKVVIYISLDIKSAFPSVPHDALLKICEQSGFSDSAVALIKNIYNNITQKVKVGKQYSDIASINNGVLQGRNFDQTFFLLYFNDILNTTEHLNGFLFADDYQAIIEVDLKNINDGINLVNSDLMRINNWLITRGLKLNTSKSKVMIIGTRAQTNKINFDNIQDVVIGDEKLEFCKNIKNLGVIFDDNMSFDAHNDAKIQKIYGILNRIRHTKNYIPNYVKRDIATAFIDPIFNYGDVITYSWGVHGTNSEDERLLIADNDKIRYIYGLKRHDHITEYREKLKALKPDENAKFHSAILIFNQLIKQSPAYLNSMFTRNNNNTRAGSNGNLTVSKPRTEFDKRQFTHSAINFWNSIPREITTLNTVGKFKTELKPWIISNRELA